MSAPRVLLFIPDLSGGGAERVVLTLLAHRSGALGYELVLCRRGGRLDGEIPAGVPVHELGKRGPQDLPALIWRMRALCRRRRPDAVISALWYADLIQLAAGWPRRPWRAVVTVHSLAGEVGRERHGRIKRGLMRRLYPRADRAYCVSEAVAKDFAAAFVRGGRPPVEVQDNPIELHRIDALAAAEPAPPRRARHRIVAVGRLHPHKGFDNLIEAAARLRDRGRDVELLIAGTGAHQGELRRVIAHCGLDERARLLGFVDNPYPLMASADVIAAPSLYEALSLVAIEALHLGIPVVGADADGGLPDVLGRGERGEIVPPSDPAALADAIERTLDQPSPARIAAGRAYAEKFCAPAVARAFEQRVLELVRRDDRQAGAVAGGPA